jgi:hypothetical protein
MRKAFDWKRSRISMLEVEADPRVVFRKSRLVIVLFLYMRSLLLIESFDFHPSNQYILARMEIVNYGSYGERSIDNTM